MANPVQNTDSKRFRALWCLHGAVLLFGLSGVLGKLTAALAVQVTFVRAALAAIVLGLSLAILRKRFHAPNTLMIVSGLLLAVHWWTFFQAIKTSSVGVGLLSFASFPVFMVLLAPLNGVGCWRKYDLMLAGIAAIGVAVLTPSFDPRSNVLQGIGWGVFSALLFAELSLLNRRLALRFDAIQIGCLQNGIAALALAAWAVRGLDHLHFSDWMILLVLGVFCTALAHLWFIRATIAVSPTQIGTTVALEPVYGIVFAMMLLHEQLILRMFLGGALILTAALAVMLDRRGHECASK